MSLKIPNTGDKVYCKKNVYNLDDELIFRKGVEYYIHFIYRKNSIKTVISIIYDDLYYTFDLVISGRLNYFDYFVDMKEYRKIKLENIFKECIKKN